ncbi:MAG: acyltransferase [Anaerolineae bacterium]|nr:acyltransferase [Anaerolineae bacterium]
MTKRLFLLMGVAILSVIVGHAAGWGQIAMFLWADRYQPVSVPNFDQIGTPSYYVLLVLRQLVVYAVPAFLFISGFFVAYAARGSHATFTWKMVGKRLKNLLIPYFIWSLIIFIGQAFEGVFSSPAGYIKQILLGQAVGPYFYVPVLCQFYLLTPFLIPLAKRKPAILLIGSACLHIGAMSIHYLGLLNVDIPGITWLTALWPWSLIWSTFYFPWGIVVGLHSSEFKLWIEEHKRWLFIALLVLAVLTVIEPEVIYRTTGKDYRFNPTTLAPALYSLAFICYFLGFAPLTETWFSRNVQQWGRQSYGIYLLHITVMELFARVVRQIIPGMLAHQVLLFFPLMFIVGLGVPLLFMKFIRNQEALRPYFRYLFG